MSLDLDLIDKENVGFILCRYQNPALAIYRTGSTVTGETQSGFDIDYLIILDSNSHYQRDYRITRKKITSRPEIDIVSFTKKDLESPSTIPEGQFDKIAYLMREINRERVLIYSDDIFMDLLNSNDLKRVARKLRIGPDTMRAMKQCVDWV